MDAIKTGLSVGAGTGGAVALLLAMRRQWLNERDQLHREQVADLTHAHAERVASASEHDAAERRVTDLYTKAADQLGNDKAPVRLAGLYALERLAQDNPAQRQAIVNVVCAYLRMPFPPQRPVSATAADSAAETQWAQERVVRLAAQSILTGHLYTSAADTEWPRTSTPDDPDFWPGISLDLTEATLLYFPAAGIRVKSAHFKRTRFIGGANFAHADFEEHVYFSGARFEGGAGHFLGAWFGWRAVFSGTDFGEKEANFEGATFAGMVFLGDSTFGGGVTLDQARALANFNTGWGSERLWPAGWTERHLASDEQMPRPYGRWANAPDLPPGDTRWRLVTRDNQGAAQSS
jgi:hypothetical protein